MNFLPAKILLVSLLLSSAICAQQLFLRKHSLPVRYINASIDILHQDHIGYIWLGSDSGLFRFDGFEFKRFNPFPAKKITALYDYADTLWIGSEDGQVSFFEKGRLAPLSNFKKQDVPITGFCAGRNGLFISTYGKSLLHVMNRSDKITVVNDMPDQFIHGLACTSDGTWAATEAGLTLVNDDLKIVHQLTKDNGLPDHFITSIAMADQLIGATESGHLFSISKDNKPALLTGDVGTISEIAVDDRSIWMSSEKGLRVYDHHTKKLTDQLAANPSFSKNIHDIMLDKEGIVWLVNSTSEFYSSNPSIQILTSEKTGEASIQSLLKDHQGDLWFSTSHGLYVETKDKARELAAETIRSQGANIIAMYQDPFNTIWMGSYGQGLYRITPSGDVKHYSAKDGLLNDNIFSITGKGNSLWIASIGGLSEFHNKPTGPELIKTYTGKEGPGSNYIYKILIDSLDRIWVATDGAGVAYLENGKFKNYGKAQGLSGSNVYSITEGQHGDIWFTVAQGGICRIDRNGKLSQLTTEDGLRDNTLSSIISDSQGNIVMVGKYGVDILNIRSGNVFYHSDEMGITNLDPDVNSIYKDPIGDIWIGGKGKILRYSPGSREIPVWPATLISSVSVYFKDTLAITELPYNMNHITFNYIGLWYHDPSEVVYQVMLEGYDREWITSRNREVTYPNLAPGSYTFKVRSSATGQFNGAKAVTYSFTIKAPFYKTAWFIVLASAVIILLSYLFLKWRVRNIKRTEEMKKQKIEFEFETLKSQVNPHFLFNSFNTLSAIIEQDKETAVEYVEKLSDFFRNVLMQREKITISISEELDQLDLYIFLQKKRYKDNFHVDIRKDDFSIEDNIAPLTLQLLVENAVKHNIVSKAKPLVVKIYREGSFIVVENNLQLKTVPEPSTGLGLENIKKRYSLLTNTDIRIEASEHSYKVYIPVL